MASLADGGGPPAYADCDSRNTCEICFAQVSQMIDCEWAARSRSRPPSWWPRVHLSPSPPSCHSVSHSSTAASPPTSPHQADNCCSRCGMVNYCGAGPAPPLRRLFAAAAAAAAAVATHHQHLPPTTHHPPPSTHHPPPTTPPAAHQKVDYKSHKKACKLFDNKQIGDGARFRFKYQTLELAAQNKRDGNEILKTVASRRAPAPGAPAELFAAEQFYRRAIVVALRISMPMEGEEGHECLVGDGYELDIEYLGPFDEQMVQARKLWRTSLSNLINVLSKAEPPGSRVADVKHACVTLLRALNCHELADVKSALAAQAVCPRLMEALRQIKLAEERSQVIDLRTKPGMSRGPESEARSRAARARARYAPPTFHGPPLLTRPLPLLTRSSPSLSRARAHAQATPPRAKRSC